jgi:hypothetical protein
MCTRDGRRRTLWHRRQRRRRRRPRARPDPRAPPRTRKGEVVGAARHVPAPVRGGQPVVVAGAQLLQLPLGAEAARAAVLALRHLRGHAGGGALACGRTACRAGAAATAPAGRLRPAHRATHALRDDGGVVLGQAVAVAVVAEHGEPGDAGEGRLAVHVGEGGAELGHVPGRRQAVRVEVVCAAGGRGRGRGMESAGLLAGCTACAGTGTIAGRPGAAGRPWGGRAAAPSAPAAAAPTAGADDEVGPQARRHPGHQLRRHALRQVALPAPVADGEEGGQRRAQRLGGLGAARRQALRCGGRSARRRRGRRSALHRTGAGCGGGLSARWRAGTPPAAPGRARLLRPRGAPPPPPPPPRLARSGGRPTPSPTPSATSTSRAISAAYTGPGTSLSQPALPPLPPGGPPAAAAALLPAAPASAASARLAPAGGSLGRCGAGWGCGGRRSAGASDRRLRARARRPPAPP